MAKVKIIKKVGIPKRVSVEWFDNLVKCSMLTPVLLKRIGKLEKKLRRLDPQLRNKEHVLVWRNVGGLGDIIMQSAIARELKNKNPNCFIIYQVPEQYLAIPKHNPYVDKTEVVECPFTENGFDRTIKLSQPCPASVYESIKEPNITKSRIDLFLEAGKIRTENKSLVYKIEDAERKWVEEFLSRNKVLNKIKIGFELRTAEPRRDWPYFKELAKLLKKDKKIKIFIFDHSEKMAWKDKDVINICGFTIEDLAAIVERMDLMICPDSGLAHLAGALGTKILGLFGPTDPRMRLNTYKNIDWIWLRNKCKESPCWYSYPCGNSRCMKEIKPRDVLRKIKRMIKK